MLLVETLFTDTNRTTELYHFLVCTLNATYLSLSVGRPITVPQVDSPSQEQVDYYHSLYMKALSELFHEHKTSCGLADTHELRFI